MSESSVYEMLRRFSAVFNTPMPTADQVAIYSRLLRADGVPDGAAGALTDAVLAVAKTFPRPAMVLEVWQEQRQTLTPRHQIGSFDRWQYLIGKIYASPSGEAIYCYSCAVRGISSSLTCVAFTLLDNRPAIIVECPRPVTHQRSCGYRTIVQLDGEEA